ncbi:hypothetical protein ACIP88_00035 [Streptomyces uncialis]|uniref:hypothetical protein n=1 Tax=Streptomyces uncialis TaxID=1048205 RepID=UPI0038309143
MKRNREEKVHPDLPGGMWHALSRLQRTHPEPVGRIGPLARPAGLLSFAAAEDIVLSARVQLSGSETMDDVHDIFRTSTRGLSWDTQYRGPGDVALEVSLGKRQEMALHTDHLTGFTRLLEHAADTISTHRTSEGGACFHCEGTGRARPLWEP